LAVAYHLNVICQSALHGGSSLQVLQVSHLKADNNFEKETQRQQAESQTKKKLRKTRKVSHMP